MSDKPEKSTPEIKPEELSITELSEVTGGNGNRPVSMSGAGTFVSPAVPNIT